jgi:S-adenosylmethionine:tRNA ribosyltransferase-isomerase
MRIADFDYQLPKDLIAQEPAPQRSSSRLLVLDRATGSIGHRQFSDVLQFMNRGDLLVLNDTRVIPARIEARKPTGGKVEILLTEKVSQGEWHCLVDGIKRGSGPIEVLLGETAALLREGKPYWTVRFPDGWDGEKVMAAFGHIPLPHYIKRGSGGDRLSDLERYQTVYAQQQGSIAAPTAGLHFDEDLLSRIASAGVAIAKITLHIGVGTFFLIKGEDVEGHHMHPEYYAISPESVAAVERTKAAGGRVIAVGTSAVRTLESAWSHGEKPVTSGCTDLFIYPGHRFKVVDRLITNFHLPRSTPLLLVSAFAGKEAISRAYTEAIDRAYRFYSYGDAMFIL